MCIANIVLSLSCHQGSMERVLFTEIVQEFKKNTHLLNLSSFSTNALIVPPQFLFTWQQ